MTLWVFSDLLLLVAVWVLRDAAASEVPAGGWWWWSSAKHSQQLPCSITSSSHTFVIVNSISVTLLCVAAAVPGVEPDGAAAEWLSADDAGDRLLQLLSASATPRGGDSSSCSGTEMQCGVSSPKQIISRLLDSVSVLDSESHAAQWHPRVHVVYVVDHPHGVTVEAGALETEHHPELAGFLRAVTTNISVTLLISHKQHALMSLAAWDALGDPTAMDEYEDLLFFNKAFTLKRLLQGQRQSLANSMQAHLLNMGIACRIIYLEDLEEKAPSPLLAFITDHWHGTFAPSAYASDQPDANASRYLMPPLPDERRGLKRWSHALLRGSVPVEEWGTASPIAATAVPRGEPIIIRNSFATTWRRTSAWRRDDDGVLTFLRDLARFCPEQEDGEAHARAACEGAEVCGEGKAKHNHKYEENQQQDQGREQAQEQHHDEEEDDDLPESSASMPPDLACAVNTGTGSVVFHNVKTSHHGRHFDADHRASMAPLPTLLDNLDFKVRNLSLSALEHLLTGGSNSNSSSSSKNDGGCETYTSNGDNNNNNINNNSGNSNDSSNSSSVFFTALPPAFVEEHLHPTRPLFLTDDDHRLGRQFAWVSTRGSVTHTHFDQDYNVFVQLSGRKRFTLFPPSQTRLLAPFPRLHPLWHKSRVDFTAPDLRRFPEYAHSRAVVAEVGPGDVLYVPPYYWHHVETVSERSLSLSTLSHDDTTRKTMDAVYRMDHKFDHLRSARGKTFALRLYIDLMVHEMVGNHPDETRRFVEGLVDRRYRGMEQHFSDDPSICRSRVEGKIPTAHHVFGDCSTDKALVTSHFAELQPAVRDILFEEYVEDLVGEVVGATKVLSFFKYCFQGQGYYLTHLGEEEHALWDYVSEEDGDEGATEAEEDEEEEE